jgi:hypothetical protein
MKAKFLALLAATAVTMAGCSTWQIGFLPIAAIKAQISPLEFEGSITRATGGYTIKTIDAQSITFQAASGSMGAVVTGFEAKFEDQSGNGIGATAVTQTLNQSVDPGKTCDTKGVCKFELGKVSDKATANLLSQEASLLFLQAAANRGTVPSGWRARITFFGINTNGVAFSWEEVQAIVCGKCSIN